MSDRSPSYTSRQTSADTTHTQPGSRVLSYEPPYGPYEVSETSTQEVRGADGVKFNIEYSDGLTTDVLWIESPHDWVTGNRT